MVGDMSPPSLSIVGGAWSPQNWGACGVLLLPQELQSPEFLCQSTVGQCGDSSHPRMGRLGSREVAEHWCRWPAAPSHCTLSLGSLMPRQTDVLEKQEEDKALLGGHRAVASALRLPRGLTGAATWASAQRHAVFCPGLTSQLPVSPNSRDTPLGPPLSTSHRCGNWGEDRDSGGRGEADLGRWTLSHNLNLSPHL